MARRRVTSRCRALGRHSLPGARRTGGAAADPWRRARGLGSAPGRRRRDRVALSPPRPHGARRRATVSPTMTTSRRVRPRSWIFGSRDGDRRRSGPSDEWPSVPGRARPRARVWPRGRGGVGFGRGVERGFERWGTRSRRGASRLARHRELRRGAAGVERLPRTQERPPRSERHLARGARRRGVPRALVAASSRPEPGHPCVHLHGPATRTTPPPALPDNSTPSRARRVARDAGSADVRSRAWRITSCIASTTPRPRTGSIRPT